MKVKYSISDCLAREGVYRAFVHVDGIKYSKDYTKHEYSTLGREIIEDELRDEVIKILSGRIVIEKAKGSI